LVNGAGGSGNLLQSEGIAFGGDALGFALGLGLEDSGLFFCFGAQDGRLLFTLSS
jgi:hypothetical protein